MGFVYKLFKILVPCAVCRVPVLSLIINISIFNMQPEYPNLRTIKVMSTWHPARLHLNLFHNFLKHKQII
jgi:hypothetical protein